MEFLKFIIDFILHIDDHLVEIVNNYGTLTYGILFLIVFAETGLVVTPLLPGDSLLFAAGALAARVEALAIVPLITLLIVAAILGDAVNYSIGKYLGVRAFEQDRWFLKKKHLEKTQAFYAKHGGKTIILARFVPIVRTYAPFVAGVAQMPYSQFGMYNIVGAIIWVVVATLAGYFFGNIPWVQQHFESVLLGIIFVSILPIFVEWIRAKMDEKKAAAKGEAA